MSSTMVMSRTETDDSLPIANFNYWSESRQNDPSEIIAMINGECKAMKSVEMPVHDVRADLGSISHETHGFQIVHHESHVVKDVQASTDGKVDLDEFISRSDDFGKETIEMVKQTLCVRSVLPLEIYCRESSAQPHNSNDARAPKTKNIGPKGKPFHIVHNDYSHSGALGMLRATVPTYFEDTGTLEVVPNPQDRAQFFALRDEILASEEDAIKQSGAPDFLSWSGANYNGPRWAHFSIWRPLEPVKQDPLAMLDPNSLFSKVHVRDLTHAPYMLGQFNRPDRPGFSSQKDYTNIMPLMPQDARDHRWLYVKDQQPNEVNFLKLFDSEAWREGSNVMPCAAHSAFTLPDVGPQPARKSVEFRVLVIW